MATGIVQIVASVLSYLSARGIDAILGKWAAYFVIAWQKVASDKALATFTETRDNLVRDMPAKWDQWDDWRKKH